ncbi:hypothetical protein BJX99DRAFT_254047 [Aspergillus californicus]
MLYPALLLAASTLTAAHTVAWTKGMYCFNDPSSNVDTPNTNTAVNPLYNLTKEDWWFQHDRGCDTAPPAAGDILALPAGGSFTVELAHNRAFTSFSYNGEFASEWPDGEDHPEDWSGADGDCIQDDGALHTYNQSMAAGTAWAISYEGGLEDVTMEGLVVFSVLEHTPWKRLATYEVPADLPACPDGGCICAWLWVPNGCGQPNIYMAGYKCNVTGATSTKQVAPAQPPLYCEDDEPQCVSGAKQIIAWNQQTGNNVDAADGKTPMYAGAWGFKNGPQNDIFVSASTSQSSSVEPTASSGSSSTTKPEPTEKPSKCRARKRSHRRALNDGAQ